MMNEDISIKQVVRAKPGRQGQCAAVGSGGIDFFRTFILRLFAVFLLAIFSGMIMKTIRTVGIFKELIIASQRELPTDNVKAIRLAEAAYKTTLPFSSPEVMPVLTAAAYSTYNRPFYTNVIHHEDSVKLGLFSPDDTKVLSISFDGTAKLSDIKSKSEIILKRNAKELVTAGCFSLGGNCIITASDDGWTTLWDMQGRKINELKQHESSATVVSFFPDGRQIITGFKDGIIKLWDIDRNRLRKFGDHTDSIRKIKFSHDEKKILTVSWDRTAQLWDLEGRMLLRINERDHSSLWDAEISPDGTKILTCAVGKSAKLWDMQKNLIAEFDHGNHWIHFATFLPDRSGVLTFSSLERNQQAILWNLNGTRKREFDLNDHTSFIKSVMFSPEGTSFLTASADKTAKVWDLNGRLLLDLDGHEDEVNSAIFSREGTKILTASKDGTTKIWDFKDRMLTEIIRKSTADLSFTKLFHDGLLILSVYYDKVCVWDLKGNIFSSIESSGIVSAVINKKGTAIFVTFDNGTAKLYNLKGELLQNYPGNYSRINSAVFNDDGTIILTVSNDGIVKLWDWGKNMLRSFAGHNSHINHGVFNSLGNKILTTSEKGIISLWNLEGKLLKNYSGHEAEVNSVTFNIDETIILSASDDKTFILWDFNGRILKKVRGHDNRIFKAQFSPDNNQILTFSADGTAKLWKPNGELICNFQHKSSVISANFSINGDRIITASHDGTAKLWNLKGKLLADLNKHRDSVNEAEFSPDGSFILTSSFDNTIKIWLTPEAIIEWLSTAAIPQLTKEEREQYDINNIESDKSYSK